MTLAVAANLGRLVKSDRRFVLLMTDSRFTYPSGAHRDDGAKLWKLASQVGAVFAGDVEIGEKSLALCQRMLSQAKPISFDAVTQNLQIAVKRFYQKKRRTYFIVGAVSPVGEARVFCVDHDLGPAVREVQYKQSKLIAIGDREAQRAFEEELDRIPSGPLNQLGTNDYAEWHLHAQPYITTFARAVGRGIATVGFPLQIMLVAEFGEQVLHLVALGDPDTVGSFRVSAGPGEVKSEYRQRERTKLQPRTRLKVQTYK